jgi:hypothetical protein
MATTSLGLGFFELVILLFGGPGLAALGAPQPLDPVMAAVAPQECLWYSSSSGVGPADPASANHTEQLFAEPQVERFLAEVERHVTAVVRRAGGPSREQRVLAAEVPKLVRAIMTRPLAMYVEDVQPGPDQSVQAEAAVVLNAGDQREDMAAALQELAALATEKGLTFTAETKGGVDWQRVGLPPKAPPVRIGWKGDYLLIAIGDATADGLVARMSGQPPAWLVQARGEHPIERELKFGYLNVAGVLERVRPLVEQQNPGVWPILEKLGLTSVTSMHGVVGYDAVGCTSMAHLVTNGERPGLLAFLPHSPLAAEDLAIVPKDALVAAAVRLNAAETVDHAVSLISSFQAGAKEDFERHLWDVETQLGVNIRKDILESLGEAWVAYLPSGDLMSSWLNSAAGVRVSQPDRLRIAVNRLVEIARSQMAQSDAPVTIVTSSLGDNTMYSLQFTREPVPMAPSWCVSEDWLVFGIMPQAVQAALDRRADESLAAAPSVGEAMKVDVPPAALFYQDTPALVRSLYPFAQLGVTMISGPLREQGIEIDPTALPSPDVILRHLRPSVSIMGHGADGFHFTSRGTLPAGGSAITAAPIVAALVVPAVQGARHAAFEAQELNHMRQIALACLNYEAANGSLPTDVYDENGKPLLSWRVRILPYMEEQVLHQQFRMNEPWDSEHNRQFLARVPTIYTSPTSPLALGRTRIVGFKGKDGMFAGDEGVRFRDITDGTSATVFFVAASPEAAVEWTRPADIDFDPTKPFAGLAQPSGQFFAAFVDGSVRRLSLGLGNDVMKALVTRAGDEPIEYDTLNSPPAPWLYNGPAAAVPVPIDAMAPVEVAPVPAELEPAIEVGREPGPDDVPAVDSPKPGR